MNCIHCACNHAHAQMKRQWRNGVVFALTAVVCALAVAWLVS